MNTTINVAEDAFRVVAQTTWQATVVAGLILLAQWIFRKRLTPAWRYGLWFLLVARLLMPTSFPSALSIFNLTKVESTAPRRELAQPTPPVSTLPYPLVAANRLDSVFPMPTHAETGVQRTIQRDHPQPAAKTQVYEPSRRQPDWLAVAVLLWLTGVFIFGLRLIWSNLRFSSRLAHHPRIEEEPILRLFDECASALGFRGQVTLIETDEVESPAVYGLWHKRVLLPEGFSERFSGAELRCVFMHELAHLKRYDLEINWLISVLQVLHWFNPALWFAFARMRADRELACDALALLRLGEAKRLSYGETILKLLENLTRPSTVPGLLGISEDKRRMKQRISVNANLKRPSRWSAAALLLVGGLGIISLTDASKGRGTASAATVDQNRDVASVATDSNPQTGLRARVLDPEGKPVADVQVKCQGFDWRATTDAEGRFEWKGLKQTYTFVLEKYGFRWQVTPPLPPGTNQNVIRLERATVIGGKVVDHETHKPIEKFEIYHARLVMNRVKPGINSHDVIMGRAGEFQYCFSIGDAPWTDSAFYIFAEGYAPQLSRPLTAADHGTELTFELVKASPVVGKVITPEGKTAAKAEVLLWSGQVNTRDVMSHDRFDTDEAGNFSLPQALDGIITVTHNSGYAQVSWEQFRSNTTIALVKWGHVKGHWPKPWPKSRRVWLQPINWSDQLFTSQPCLVVEGAEVNSQGDFEFPDVPPGEYKLGEYVDLAMHWPGGGTSMMLLQNARLHLVVEAGQTAVVEVPDGRSIGGRVALPDAPDLTTQWLPVIELSSRLAAPDFPYPNPDPSLSDRAKLKALQDWKAMVLAYWLSNEGKASRRAEYRFKTHADPDGSFRLDHLPPGDYSLVIYNASPAVGHSQFHRDLSIPSSSDVTPVELGVLNLSAGNSNPPARQLDNQTNLSVRTYSARTSHSIPVPWNHTMVVGGWKTTPRRITVVFATPKQVNDPTELEIETKIVEFRTVSAAKLGLNFFDYPDAYPESPRSRSSVFPPGYNSILEMFKDTPGITELNLPLTKMVSGQSSEVQVLESKQTISGQEYFIHPKITILPKISEDGQSVDLEIDARLTYSLSP